MSVSSARQAIEELCLHHQAAILELTPQRLKIAVAASPSSTMMEALRFACQSTIEVEYWPQARLQQFLQRQDNVPVADAELAGDSQKAAPERIDRLLALAVQRRASDIHIEPQSDSLRIRLRVDGVLQTLPAEHAGAGGSLLARLKILASLDISERRIPQDGQFLLELNGQTESFRLSTLPTRFGEKAVIRLLQSHTQAVALENLGMSPALLRRYRQALARPQGLILATGPTGSGKTFTLYSGLSWLNHPQRNLCSVEDPIEIPLPGVNQTQINVKAGLDFNLVLRALLRQDPDVIMLGEIRDGETAETAVKAAQTGHLVLSTLHTNSTTETLIRLGQIGIPGYLLASALELVIAQRLVRRLCPHCRQPAAAVADFPASVWPGTVRNWRAVGCERCFSGFYGRIALFELMPVTPRLQIAIAAGESPEALADIARQQGMNALFTEGLHCVNRGDTTLEELYRIVSEDDGCAATV